MTTSAKPPLAVAQAAAAKRTKKKAKSQYGYHIAIAVVIIATIFAVILGITSGPGPTRSQGSRAPSPLDNLVNDKSVIADVMRSPNFTAVANPFFDKWTLADVKYGFDGVKISSLVGMPGAIQHCEEDDTFEGGIIPANFDGRTKWPGCLNEKVVNSGNCSGSYAIAAAQSLAARFCVADEEKYGKVRFSAQQILSCDKKSQGCKGGGIDSVWSYLQRRGLYPEECVPFVGKNGPECSAKMTKCDASKKLKPISHCVKRGVKEIKREILENGPVVAPVVLSQDFMVYSGGVFSRLDNVNPLFGSDGEVVNVAVVIIGWGKSEGIPYWLVENSWGETWGESGYGKIAIGSAGNLHENYVVVGYPETAEALEKAEKDRIAAEEKKEKAKKERAERDERIAAQRKARAEAQKEVEQDLDNFDDVDDLDDIDLEESDAAGGNVDDVE